MKTNTPNEIATTILWNIYMSNNPINEILKLSDIDSEEIFQLLKIAKLLNSKLEKGKKLSNL